MSTFKCIILLTRHNMASSEIYFKVKEETNDWPLPLIQDLIKVQSLSKHGEIAILLKIVHFIFQV